jgi:hypothetical protein
LEWVERLDGGDGVWVIESAGGLGYLLAQQLLAAAADEEVHSDETVACGIPGLDQPGQEVRATTLQADVEPLAWEWSDRWGFATNFAYRADR